LTITCDVAAHHLILTDEVLNDFDSNYKVKPPLRIQNDRDALIAGLKDNTIDAIVSQHTPQEIELKEVEFETAAFGMLGLQTAFSLTLKSGLTITEIVDKMAVNPRKILGLPVPNIGESQKANLVLFDVDTEWEYNLQNNFSKSTNSPFLGNMLKGKVWMCVNNGQVWKAE
jgi:dihydroorotase